MVSSLNNGNCLTGPAFFFVCVQSVLHIVARSVSWSGIWILPVLCLKPSGCFPLLYNNTHFPYWASQTLCNLVPAHPGWWASLSPALCFHPWQLPPWLLNALAFAPAFCIDTLSGLWTGDFSSFSFLLMHPLCSLPPFLPLLSWFLFTFLLKFWGQEQYCCQISSA